MAVVGEASIIVRAVTTGVKNDIQRAFDGLDQVGDRAGRDAGASFSKGFRNRTSGDVAFLFGKSLSQKDVNKFTDARERFLKLARVGYTLATALTAIGGVLGSIVGGLGVLISITAAATPALLGLSSAFLAVAASVAVLKSTFKGVGDAIEAGGKTGQAAVDAEALQAATDRLNDAYYNLNQTLKDNKKRKEEAIEAIEEAGEAEANASIAVERAERTYRDAVRNTQRALENVTEAREEAKEAIQQLRFELEGGVISEKKARLEFEKARDSLQRVQDLPPNSRARREAELAFAEADLNLRRAIDKNNDLRKSTAKANREGVDGNERVIDAQDRLVAAREAENDANIDAAKAILTLKEATEDLNKAREFAIVGGELDIQNARALELAYREVERAKSALAKTKNPGVDDFQTALDKLSPAAQDFVIYILSLKEAFEELRKKLQEAFFPKFTEAVELLYNTYFAPGAPASLEGALISLAAKLGELSKDFADVFSEPGKAQEVKEIFESFTPIVDALGGAFIALASAFTALTAAFIPYSIEFAEFLKKKSEAFDKTVALKKETGELNEIFKTATDIVKKLGEGFGNAFSAFGTIISATVAPGGAADTFLQWFIDVTAGWEETTKKLNEEGKLAPFLTNLTIGAQGVLEVIGLIALGFMQIAASPGYLQFVESMKEVTRTFNEVGLELSKEDGAIASLGKFLEEFAKTIQIFTEAGPITIFFDVLTVLLKTVNTILDTELGRNLLIVTGSMLAFSAAVSLTNIALTFYVSALKGATLKMIAFMVTGLSPLKKMPIIGGMVTKLTQNLAFLTYGAGFVSTPFLLIAAAIAAVIAVLILAYNKSEIFRKAMKELVDGVLKALKEAFDTIGDALAEVFPELENFGDFFKTIGDFIGKYVVPVFEIILVTAIKGIADARAGVIKIGAGLFRIFTDPIGGVKLILSGFMSFLRGIGETILSIFRIGNIWGFLSDGFKATINKVIGWWNNFKLELRIPNNVASRLLGIAGAGFTIDTPNINFLAKGGIVSPTSGGTLAMIGEAGRPERVEPLDPDGLSKRDKAMISMLAGPAGGINITVNPSPGMDERELAALVSRQLAFQLRKGAA
jgi:hypothetical protein